MSNKVNPSEGLSTVTPYFTVPDADGFITFLHALFGAELIKETRYGDGTVQHARLRIGTSVLMLNQATADYPANISQMHIQVSSTPLDKCHHLKYNHYQNSNPHRRNCTRD